MSTVNKKRKKKKDFYFKSKKIFLNCLKSNKRFNGKISKIKSIYKTKMFKELFKKKKLFL